MQTFEIRLMAEDGSTILIHLTVCNSVHEARERADAINNVSYERYEIWRGARKVADGTNSGRVA
ncbi:MAG TPA: hypothetical protein VID67_08300 [Rhizomicrobium sp.]|jgi:hypothetical protein